MSSGKDKKKKKETFPDLQLEFLPLSPRLGSIFKLVSWPGTCPPHKQYKFKLHTQMCHRTWVLISGDSFPTQGPRRPTNFLKSCSDWWGDFLGHFPYSGQCYTAQTFMPRPEEPH